MRKKTIFIFLLIILTTNIVYGDTQAKIDKTVIDLNNTAQITTALGTYGTAYWKKPSESFEFFDKSGYLNIIFKTTDSTKMGWVTYDINSNKKISEKTIERKLTLFGNGMYYNNYVYIMYGANDYTTDKSGSSDYGTSTTLELVKYDMNGNIVKTLEISGIDTSRVDIYNKLDVYKGYGTKKPFDSGQCDMSVNNKGIIKAVFNREMYNGHTMSAQVYVNSNTLEHLNKHTTMDFDNPYYHADNHYIPSHSFEERVILTSDNEFLSADLTDGEPERGFYIAKTDTDSKGTQNLDYHIPFHFRESADVYGENYNETFASLGNIIEVSDGYILIGSSEKTLSLNYAPSRSFNESRNIFIQKYNKDLSKETKDIAMFNTTLRKSESSRTDTKNKGKFELDDKLHINYGVKWLTNYQNDYSSTEVRALKINNNNIMIIWSTTKLKKSSSGNYYLSDNEENYYYEIIDSNGNIVRNATKINNAIPVDFIHYNYNNGYVYWANVLEQGNKMTINKLNVNSTEVEPSITRVSNENITITDSDNNTTNLKVNYTANNKVLWSSSSTGVVTVDEAGKVTALKNGSAIITASLDGYNSKKVTFNITVDFKVKQLVPTQESVNIEVGDYTYVSKTNVYPENAANKKITWVSSNEKIATVGDYGSGTGSLKVSAVGPGTTTIIGTASDGSGVTAKITINTYIKIKEITFDKTNYQLIKGEKVKLGYTVSPSNANVKVTMKSGNTRVATIDDNGNITAVGTGSANIFVSGERSSISYTIKVTVTNPLKDIILEQNNYYLKAKDKAAIKVTPNPSDTTDSYTLSYTSANTKIATVSRYGTITAISNGTTTITVKTSTGIEKKCTVIVGDYLKGDMNKNGKIDLKDIIILLKKYLKTLDTTNDDLSIGDMDNNGSIGIKDIILVLRAYLNTD